MYWEGNKECFECGEICLLSEKEYYGGGLPTCSKCCLAYQVQTCKKQITQQKKWIIERGKILAGYN